MVIKIKEFLIMFAIQVTSYSLLCINFRAVAQAHYTWSALSDFVFASLSYFIIKRIAHSDNTFHQWLGYALGGVVGSLFGIWLSTVILGG
jgi:hypothetical protein